MKFSLFLYLLAFITQFGQAQNLNMVIEVNERLVESGITSAYLNFEAVDGTTSKNLVSYYPGELVLEPEDWQKINSELTKEIILSFNYTDYSKKRDTSLNIKVGIQKEHFEMPYLILRIYDFKNKKFKKRYSCLTDKDFIAEFGCQGCGVLVTCK
jgi:hypothetical protein